MDPGLFASIMRDVELIVGEEKGSEVQNTQSGISGMQNGTEMESGRAE